MFGFRSSDRKVYTVDEIADIVGPIAAEYGAERVWLFGSYARGEADRHSDIDLVVRPGKGWGIRIGTFWRELTEALGKDVDLATDADVKFMDHIRDDLVLIYG